MKIYNDTNQKLRFHFFLNQQEEPVLTLVLQPKEGHENLPDCDYLKVEV